MKGLQGQLHIQELEKMKNMPGMKGFGLGSNRAQIKDLLESLTPEQKAKQDKQGYLTMEDLTPKQRAMLGDIPKDGNWTFSYSIEGKHVTIKSKAGGDKGGDTL